MNLVVKVFTFRNVGNSVKMAALFGIHVGNTSACLAIWKDEDRFDVVANDAGDRVTPTVVQWTTENCVVGRAAQVEHYKNEANTVVRNKQLLNENISDDELENLKSKISYRINKSEKCLKYELVYEGKQYHVLPRDILFSIIKKIHAIAKAAVSGDRELSVVITVPLHFSPKTIELIRDVVRKVGFHVLQVIDEPSSAALGAGLGTMVEEKPYHCLIYRIGGVTLDATILLVQDGLFSVVSTVHKYNLGGVLFTEKLADFLTNEFKRQYRSAEITSRSRHKLYSAAENVKQILSIQNLAQCSAESVGGGYDLNCSVSRARFENIISPYLPLVLSPVNDAIEKAGLSIDQIKKVVFCGGSLKIPKLQEALRNVLTSAEVINNSSPDELISIGAAMQAGFSMKHQLMPEELSINTPSLSALIMIKVKTGDRELTPAFVVPEQSALPLKRHYKVTNKDSSVTATIELVQKGVTHLGSVQLDEIDESVGFANIDLEINKDGQLLLTLSSGSKKNHFKHDLNEV